MVITTSIKKPRRRFSTLRQERVDFPTQRISRIGNRVPSTYKHEKQEYIVDRRTPTPFTPTSNFPSRTLPPLSVRASNLDSYDVVAPIFEVTSITSCDLHELIC